MPAVSEVADNFEAPHLPPAQVLLDKVSFSANDVAEQAKDLQSTFLEQQRQAEAALNGRRKEFEDILTHQAMNNHHLGKANEEMHRALEAALNENKATWKNVQLIHKGNQLLISATSMLEGKMAMAAEFMQDLVHDSDDSPILKLVSEPSASPASLGLRSAPTSEGDFEALLADAVPSSRRGSSLLQELGSTQQGPTPASTEYMMRRLASSFNALAESAASGERALNVSFTRASEDGEKRHTELLVESSTLNATFSRALERRKALHLAEARVIATRHMLNERLHGFRVFVRRVDDLVDMTTQQAASMGQVDDADLKSSSTPRQPIQISSPKVDEADLQFSSTPRQPIQVSSPKAAVFTEHGKSPLSQAVAAVSREAAAAKKEADQSSAGGVAKAVAEPGDDRGIARAKEEPEAHAKDDPGSKAPSRTSGSALSNTMSWFFPR